jgi:hypothetical protein
MSTVNLYEETAHYWLTGLHGIGYVSNTHGLSVDAPKFKLLGLPTSFLSDNERSYVSFGVAILNRR